MSHEITPNDAYLALLRRIESGETVVATFEMADKHATVMRIEVGGVRAPFYFNMRRDGTWGGVSTLEL